MNLKMFVLCMSMTCIIFFTGCNSDEDSFTSDYRVGVIETTSVSDTSILSLYNENYKQVGKINVDMGSLASVSSYVKYNGKSVFVLPLGVAGSYEHTGVLEIDMYTGERVMHNLGMHMIMDFVVDDRYIYAINSKGDNGLVSDIARYERKTGVVKQIEIKDIIIENIYLQNNKIIVCGIGYNGGKIYSKMYFLSMEDFSVEKEMDFSKYGISVTDILYTQDKYYIALATEADEEGISEKKSENIIVMDNNYEMKKMKVEHTVSQILEYCGKIYAIGYDKVEDMGNMVMVIDNNIQKEVYYLDDKPRQVAIYNDKLIVLGEDNLLEYDILKDCKLSSTIKLNKNIANNEGYFSSFYINKFYSNK